MSCISVYQLVAYPLCLGNVLKDFSVDYLKQNNWKQMDMCMIFQLTVKFDVDNAVDFHKYLINENNIK